MKPLLEILESRVRRVLQPSKQKHGHQGFPSDQFWEQRWLDLAHDYLARANRPEEDYWHALGYLHFGGLLLGFALWVENQAQRQNLTRLHFLSRDGHVVFAAHQRLMNKGLARTPGGYLHASRRAWILPSFSECDEEALSLFSRGSSEASLAQHALRLGVDLQRLPCDVVSELRRDFPAPLHPLRHKTLLKRLIRQLAPYWLEVASSERTLLLQYLKENHALSKQSQAIVDIGWHGSLQHSLQRLLSPSNLWQSPCGLYLGTFQRNCLPVAHQAYLFQRGKPKPLQTAVQRSVEVYEWFFSAPHGSVIGFHSADEGIIPIFAPESSETLALESAARAQQGALQFIDDALDNVSSSIFPLSPPLAICMTDDLLRRPTLLETLMIGRLPHIESGGTGQPAQTLISLPEYSLWSGQWPSLFSQWRRSYWRRGFARLLFERSRSRSIA